eukprot:EG_transcript_36014
MTDGLSVFLKGTVPALPPRLTCAPPLVELCTAMLVQHRPPLQGIWRAHGGKSPLWCHVGHNLTQSSPSHLFFAPRGSFMLQYAAVYPPLLTSIPCTITYYYTYSLSTAHACAHVMCSSVRPSCLQFPKRTLHSSTFYCPHTHWVCP